jgi:hypothetical protein
VARLLLVHHTSSPGQQAMFFRAVESIASGLKWRRARPPACVLGQPARGDLEACWELGAPKLIA